MAMSQKKINKLAKLLNEFIRQRTNHSSLYGRSMDVALASDLLSALVGYGLPLELYQGLKKGEIK